MDNPAITAAAPGLVLSFLLHARLFLIHVFIAVPIKLKEAYRFQILHSTNPMWLRACFNYPESARDPEAETNTRHRLLLKLNALVCVVGKDSASSGSELI